MYIFNNLNAIIWYLVETFLKTLDLYLFFLIATSPLAFRNQGGEKFQLSVTECFCEPSGLLFVFTHYFLL